MTPYYASPLIVVISVIVIYDCLTVSVWPMQGELAATAVNAPMVPAEVLAELQPFVSLSQGLGRAAVQLVRDTGFTDIKITYHSPRYPFSCMPLLQLSIVVLQWLVASDPDKLVNSSRWCTDSAA